MNSCANSHDRDETCASCDPERLPPRPEKPGPPLRRDRALERVHELRDRLAHVDGFPAIPIEPDDDQPDDDAPTEETATA